MAEDDTFDIDIYGDDGVETDDFQHDNVAGATSKDEGHLGDAQVDGAHDNFKAEDNGDSVDIKVDNHDQDQRHSNDDRQQIGTTQGPAANETHMPRQAPVQQGLKRKEGQDDRSVESGASSAIIVSELNWWTTDDDIRGWANQCCCEDELNEITFSEHKVNGKSKGQAYLDFTSPQAATAVKQKIEKFSEGQPAARRHVVAYTSPGNNPFKTVPKDNRPSQNGTSVQGRGSSGSYGGGEGGRGGYNNSGFRGRGAMGGRGGGMNHSNSRGNYGAGQMNGMAGGFQGPMAGAFAGPMGAMGGFNNFNAGGMMMGGMRGGAPRGGFNGFNRGAMMGGMGAMGGMPMGMPMMGGMANGGFGANGQGHFNPAFFQGQQMGATGADGWNPHGNKRMRPE